MCVGVCITQDDHFPRRGREGADREGVAAKAWPRRRGREGADREGADREGVAVKVLHTLKVPLMAPGGFRNRC